MNHGGVCRTAPATPGLLNILRPQQDTQSLQPMWADSVKKYQSMCYKKYKYLKVWAKKYINLVKLNNKINQYAKFPTVGQNCVDN